MPALAAVLLKVWWHLLAHMQALGLPQVTGRMASVPASCTSAT